MAKVRYNQSLLDIALQTTGSLEGLVELAIANGLSVTQSLQIGQNLSDVAQVKADVVAYLQRKGVNIATGAEMFYPPVIDLSPATLAFPNTIVGNTSSLSFIIKNTGGANLNVTAISLPAQFTSGFAPSSIAPNGTIIVNVTYTPATAGVLSGNIIVSSNADSGINTIGVTATGVLATRVISVSPTSLAFGTVEVGNTNTLSFTISNTGNSSLSVTSLTFPFATYTADFNSGTIVAGGSQLVNVTYTPTGNATENGNITVNSNATSVVSNTVAVTAVGFRNVGVGLNGTTNNIRTAVAVTPPTALQPFTISMLIRTGASVAGIQVLQEFLVNNQSYTIALNVFGASTGRIAFYKQQGALLQAVQTQTPSPELAPNTVYRVQCVSNGNASTMQIYVNAVSQNLNTVFNNTLTDTAPSSVLILGARNADTSISFKGNIYDYRLYNKVLDSTERAYENSTSFVPTTAVANLVHQYEMQEAQNTTLVADAVGGKNMALTNFTAGELLVSRRYLDNSVV